MTESVQPPASGPQQGKWTEMLDIGVRKRTQTPVGHSPQMGHIFRTHLRLSSLLSISVLIIIAATDAMCRRWALMVHIGEAHGADHGGHSVRSAPFGHSGKQCVAHFGLLSISVLIIIAATDAMCRRW